MPDSFQPDSDSFEPEGGAEGGGEGPSKPLIRPRPVVADPDEEKRRMALAVSGMTGGQNLASLPEEQQDAFRTKSTEKALGEGIALARGVPLTGAHIDELSALLQTGKAGGPVYEQKREAARGAVDKAVSDNPALPLVGSLALGAAQPSTAVERVALSTGAGLSEGVGDAPKMADVPERGAKGGAIGLTTGLLGELFRSGGGVMGAKREGVEAATRAEALKKAQKAFGSAVGSEGGLTAAEMKRWDRLEDAMFNPAATEESKAAARAIINSDEGKALYNRVLKNYIEGAPGGMGRLDAAREGVESARAGMAPDAVEAATQARLNDSGPLMRRLGDKLPKLVLPVVGAALGGTPGAAVGALAGQGMGRTATTIRNMMTDPYLTSGLYGLGESGLNAAGAATNAMTPSVARNALEPWSKFLAPNDEEP